MIPYRRVSLNRAPPRNTPPRLAAGDPVAWYDVRDKASMILDGSNRCSLIADKSGNSAINVMAQNGANAGNCATAPNSSALNITGDLDLRAYIAPISWTPTAIVILISKEDTNQLSFTWRLNTTGAMQLFISTNGTTFGFNGLSSASITGTAFVGQWVRATYNHTNGNIIFYTSPDNATWVQLGTTQSTAGGNINAGTSTIGIGGQSTSKGNTLNGIYYRAQIYNGIAGTLVFDADFSKAAKLASTFTESSTNAATVTINTTGDLGARICGARDLVNLTLANQPIWSSAGLTFNGTSQYLAGAGFALAQPVSDYLTGQQLTWTTTDVLIDGRTVTTMQILQTGSTPQLNISAGSSVASNGGLAVATTGALTAIFNGASSSLRVNRGTATTGNAGAGVPNGITLGASATPGLWGNLLANELLVYAANHDTTAQNRLARYEGYKFGFAA